MGIYISGVKGLPEQVQENKEKIATIEEEIEGIDFDAIHNLENQVAENTQDIDDLQQGQGVQDTAINAVASKTSALNQSATTLTVDSNLDVSGNISFTEDDSGNIELNNETNGGNRIVSKQDSNNYISFDSSNCLHIMSDGGEYEFNEDEIKVNGTPIGGGKSIYNHNIYVSTTSNNNFLGSINFYSDSNTPLTSRGDLCAYCYNNSVRVVAYGQVLYNSVWYNCIGAIFGGTNNLDFKIYDGSSIKTESWSLLAGVPLTDSVREV